MSKHQGRRADRAAAQRLLHGGSGGSVAGADRLADLLAAAAAPGSDDELAGERAAMTAFRTARSDRVDEVRRGSMLKPALAKLVTAKIVLAAAATTAAVGGGVVVAAKTGTLPASGGGTHGNQPSSSSRPSERPSDQQSQAGTHPRGSAAPSPSVVGLCHAYTAGVGDNPGRALDSSAFTVLVQRAGGRDRVAAYCDTVLAGQPGNAPSAHPTGASGEHGRPSTHSTAPPRTHPTGHGGEPDHPGSRPTATPSHPSH